MWDTFILNPMINALLGIYGVLGSNFGLAIIVFTAVVRLITLPLTLQQQRSTQKMQDLQKSKRWVELQKKYKNEKQKLQEQQLKLYQEMGINPLSGCLPLLIQFPVIIGLYQAIIQSLAATPVQLLNLGSHLYEFVSATTIPLNSRFLWMDLGQPEHASFPIPILAILVVISTFLQTKLTTPPTPDSQGSQMTQMMTYYMPILLGYFAYTYAAGLALYFVVSNLLAVAQYAAMGKVDWRNVLSFRRTT